MRRGSRASVSRSLNGGCPRTRYVMAHQRGGEKPIRVGREQKEGALIED